MAVIMAILGFGIGYIAACLAVLKLKVGVLKIDRSDPSEAPYMFLELNKDVGDLSDRKYALLTISNENYLSQQ